MQMQDKIPLASFINKGKKFYIEKCLAKCIQDNIHLATPHNFERYLPTCDLIDNSLYIFGGALENKTGTQTMLYEYNIRTNQWRGIKSSHDVNFRYGQASASYKNTIYYFGGITSEGASNDFYTYQPYQNKWTVLEHKGQPPCPRERCFLIHTAEKYLICFGGLNDAKKQAYFDGFIWSQEQGWSPLQNINPPKKRVNFSLKKIGNKLIMFGGQGAQDRQQYFNDIYIIDLELNEKKLIFNKMQISSLDEPTPRIGYAMQILSENYFVIAGGQTKINEQMQCLRDIWVFDMNQRQWQQIQPKNGVFFYLRYSSYAMYKNTIFFYSGLDKKNSIVNRLYTLSFHQKQKTNSQLCSLCAQRNVQIFPKATSYPQELCISIGYIYNLAIEIKCCFQAFSLLADSARLQKADQMNISMMKGTSDFLYIDVTYNGKILNKTQFNNFILHADEQQQLGQKIKLGSFRLGKTFVFISAGDDIRRVCMFSANSKICPNFDETYCYFSYAQNVGNGHFLSSDGVQNKNFIVNSLNLFVESPSDLLDAKGIKNRILIFENHALMTSNKIFYYELVSQNPQNIQIYKNRKKIEFLEKIGQKISSNPELSLANYLSIYNQSAYMLKLSINNTQPISTLNIPLLFQQLQQKNLIKRLIVPENIKLGETSINIFTSATEQYLSQGDLGILIFLQQRLINRHKCEFGELFQQKFYKKKYRQPQILFKIFGYITFDPKEVQMDILGIKIKSSIKYKQFEKKLNKFITKVQRDLVHQEIEQDMLVQEQEQKIIEKQV